MKENNEQDVQQNSVKSKSPLFHGELALLIAVLVNSFGVVLMLYSGAGISAISSVPFAFSEVLPKLSLGTWTYIFQGILVFSLMVMRKRFVPSYLFSFVVGFAFSEMLDVNELPIIPTDLFPRELSAITTVKYSKIKIGFDVTCLAVTGLLTFLCLGYLDGLGIGTILAAFTMGKVVGMIGDKLDSHFNFDVFKPLKKLAVV